jgi:hypothetical protein
VKYFNRSSLINNYKKKRRSGYFMNALDVPVWTAILGNFGFPIAITVYLFYRFEKKIENLEVVIFELNEVIKDGYHKFS